MTDGFWNQPRPQLQGQPQPQLQLQPQLQPQSSLVLPSQGLLKRPRLDFEAHVPGPSSGHNVHSYTAVDEDRAGPRAVKDTQAIGSAYDRFLQSTQISSMSSGEGNGLGGVGLTRLRDAGVSQLPGSDLGLVGRPGVRGMVNGQDSGFQDLIRNPMLRPTHEPAPLPHGATSTLYIEGLPSNSTRREVAHIFRPFLGYKEVRLVTKESKHRGGDPIILCFVDFADPACAATALSALQGYKMDEQDTDSAYLRLQFSRSPGPKSGYGPRGRR
ncbi:hypothetical protein MLD38_013088 [Melastoma candidum]|uniref:Uncharacterized protein n=1 Tax=Melastoma candidum TaxID=119954 RepID=A0ACB9RC28_9MYRT|nr:hypothetical protein MLD38_013088 [Melastoma candidum]